MPPKIPIYLSIIISFQPDFVYPSNKKDLDENESIKVINLKLCDCFSSARFSASFGVSLA